MKEPFPKPHSEPLPPAAQSKRVLDYARAQAGSEPELIKTTVVRVAGADIAITTIKHDNPFLLLPYETCAANNDGVTVAEVFHNSCITTALMSHDALVRMLTMPSTQVKKAP